MMTKKCNYTVAIEKKRAFNGNDQKPTIRKSTIALTIFHAHLFCGVELVLLYPPLYVNIFATVQY